MKVKICGIKTYETAKASIEYGTDFLGFNFVPTSKRFIKPELAKEIIDRLPKSVAKVGVFMNAELKEVNNLISYLKLDYVQLHGNESPKYIDRIENAGIIKTFSLPSEFDVEKTIQKMKKYTVDYFLLDREKQERGELLNLDKVRKLTDIFPIILAGGLTVENVSEIVAKTKHLVVDVAKGVEINGVKELELIKQFIQNAKNTTKKGYFGQFGGQFVTELLYSALTELESAFYKAIKDRFFIQELERLLFEFAGRPTPLYFAKNTSDSLGFKVYFKREDLLNGGSHKLNNALGQVLLAKMMGKKRIVTETAAGMHGVATIMAANVVGFNCQVFMGVKDMERQKLNAEKIKLLGGKVIPVTRGSGVLKDAVSEALVYWIRNLTDVHYLMGSTVGPHPFPTLVAYFQKMIGEETRKQILEKEGTLPQTIIACGSGGSNALGIFQGFLKDEVELVFVEGAGASAFTSGSVGIFQGTKTYLLQDNYGMNRRTTSRTAGLNYPARGPQLSYLYFMKRIKVASATDEEVIKAYTKTAKLEGLLPALETCHALVELYKRNGRYKKDDIVILNFSGRGDKDMEAVLKTSTFRIKNYE